ncbi:hypothetical protein VTJ04DRAFT_3386 [Mycothermus thermophilus]|uniref:uncharacterized protein n=1 Tax=Humicola insolens TaxID=85995 RepID=UPI003742B69F
MVLNTLATIGIVFTNKAIFTQPALKLAQLTFASFHFLVTYLTLFLLSRPWLFNLFQPRRVPLSDILPLSVTMSLNVILPNLSLAFSTVTFYQIARILLTPTVAALNYLLYGSVLPRRAVLALVPACVGVGLVSYYDSLPSARAGKGVQTTAPLGILFALAGTVFSSLYTVWIAAYHRRLRLSSMQLLFNQAPVSAFLLLYVIPFLDTWPAPVYDRSVSVPMASSLSWLEMVFAFPQILLAHLRGWAHTLAEEQRWMLVVLSGLFASAINVSQFFIVARAGPVSSTMVGHVKTCCIVALGWVVSGRGFGDWGALLGVGLAVGGIIA